MKRKGKSLKRRDKAVHELILNIFKEDRRIPNVSCDKKIIRDANSNLGITIKHILVSL